MEKLMEKLDNSISNLQSSLNKETKYAPCQKKDVESGKYKNQLHGTFGSETAIYITDEKDKDGKKYYQLKIEKPGHDSVYT